MTPGSVQARPLVQLEDSSVQIPEALEGTYLTHISVPQAVTPILRVTGTIPSCGRSRKAQAHTRGP